MIVTTIVFILISLLRGRAVAHHMFADENNWFLDLNDNASILNQARMTERYADEYKRRRGYPRLRSHAPSPAG